MADVAIDNEIGGGIFQGAFVVILVLIFSVLYVQWNSHAASRDAAEYAAKVLLQQNQQEDQRKRNDKADNGIVNTVGNSTSESQTERSISTEASTEEEEGKNGTSSSPQKSLAEAEEPMNEKTIQDEKKAENEQKGNVILEEGKTSTKNLFDNQWRCACEGGFLPPGMLQSLGGAEAVFKMGMGECYHKQT